MRSSVRGALALVVGGALAAFLPRPAAAELLPQEIRTGAADLERKVAVWRPEVVAFLGMGAYRTAYAEPGAAIGLQPRRIAGARVWLLPNPSGLNANYQLPDLVAAYSELAQALDPVSHRHNHHASSAAPSSATAPSSVSTASAAPSPSSDSRKPRS